MKTANLLLISQAVSTLIELWRNHIDKPADWVPTEQDWDDLLAMHSSPIDEVKAAAAARLGVPWPPPPTE